MKDRIIKTEQGYFFDTEAGYYLKLSDEICDVIDAPSSNFQEEGERWELVSDLIDDTLITDKQFNDLTLQSLDKGEDENR